jgi:hypothetical protein
MAHFAKIDKNNVITEVIVVNNNEITVDGKESEQRGIEFCNALFGGTWIQTSYNGNFRKNYAGIGYTYDPARNAFIPPQPFASWTLNEETCRWQAPVTPPDDGDLYYWSEDDKNWIKHSKPTPIEVN